MLRTTPVLALACVATASCAGNIDADGVGGEPAIAIAPAGEASYQRDSLDEFGGRVAEVDIDLAIGGISRIEIVARGQLIGEFEATAREMSITVLVPMSGTIDLEARGIDSADDVLVSATQSFTVTDPDFECAQWLDFFAIDFAEGPATKGISTPITATLPIANVPYRFVSNDDQRGSLLADCSLIVALAESAGVLKERGVTEVADIGIYNYRCIGGGEPPDCPNGVSQHAYAKAIDIAGYTTVDGSYFSVNDDWVIDGDNEEVCDAATEDGKDTFLHEIICAQKARGVWNIALTPNYNAAHRNHFHVDLTDGSDFIGVTGSGGIGH